MMAALARAGHDIARPTVEMLNLVDQLHMGGLNSTKDQAELVGVTSDMRVLDAGAELVGRVAIWPTSMVVRWRLSI